MSSQDFHQSCSSDTHFDNHHPHHNAERSAVDPTLQQVQAELSATQQELQALRAKYESTVVERKQTDEALRTSEAYFQQVWTTSSDALVLSDAAGIVLAANPAYLELYGYTLTEVVGQDFAIIFPVEERAGAMQQYRNFFTSNIPVAHFESAARRADGTIRFVDARAIFFTTPGAQRVMLSIIQDITERKEAAAALQRAHEELESKVQERTNRLVETNNELQAAIIERTQNEAHLRQVATLLTRAEQAERRRIAQILHDDLQQQLYATQMRLMSVLFDTTANTRLEQEIREAYAWLSNSIEKTRQLTVDLSPPVLKDEGLVDALRWLVRQMAETHGLQVQIQAAHAFHLADEDMRVLLFQIVRELLFNVVKHAGTDQALVELQEGADGSILLMVSDQGRGFDMTQVKATTNGGFGLFSVRERLRLFGGQMTIVSAPGQGTRVLLSVPLTDPSPATSLRL